jgi:hypothetical protein
VIDTCICFSVRHIDIDDGQCYFPPLPIFCLLGQVDIDKRRINYFPPLPIFCLLGQVDIDKRRLNYFPPHLSDEY